MSTKTKAELLERLKKVQAIALRGEENEKQSAAAFLEKLMKKYGFTERDFEEEQTELAYYRYKTELEERLLSQIIYMIVGDRPLYVRRSARNNRPYKLTGVYCTAAERIEIEATYDFYKEALYHDLLMFYRAFIHKNELFPPPGLEVKTKNEGAVSRNELMKMAFLMEGMDRHIMRPLLESEKEEVE